MAVIQEKYRVIFVAPASFFYQAPIFRELANHPRIDLKVLFCSDEAVRGFDVQKKFNIDGDWGDAGKTLDGYDYQFVRNYSPFASYLRWPFGLINLGLWNQVRKSKPHAVVLMSWVNISDFVTVSSCLTSGTSFLFMTDANIKAETIKPKLISWIKGLVLRRILFKLADGFLCSGSANRQFYEKYGVPEKKLVTFAFSWESHDFLRESKYLAGQRRQLRSELGLPEKNRVILFCGRLSREKNPHELLEAFGKVDSPHKSLVFVGDGLLRESLERYVRESNIDSVHFVGFQNRKEVAKFYAISDALVIPSRQEATGAVMTEAMCFGMPVIASDQVGFGMDLIEHGSNGFIYPVGDTDMLANYITQITEASEETMADWSAHSLKRIEEWTKLDLAESLLDHLDHMHSGDNTNAA